MNAKLKTNNDLKKIIADAKNKGRKISAVNGSFDILHPAHLRLLKKAKELGDISVILLNSERAIRKYKGKTRPVISQEERADLLSLLDFVDYITIFEGNDPLELVEFLVPDLVIRGEGDFKPERLKQEKRMIEKIKAKLIILPFEKDYSTTKIIQKVLDLDKNEKNY